MRRGRFSYLDEAGSLRGHVASVLAWRPGAAPMSSKPFRFLFFTSVALCLMVPLLTFRTLPAIGERLFHSAPPPDPAIPPKFDDEEPKPEFYPWETTSYFNPVAQDATGKTTDELCESFPKHLLRNFIQPVLKMGHGENPAKINAQLESVSACMDNLIIFSDVDETIQNRTVYDILADLPESYRTNNPDFDNYLALKEMQKNGTIDDRDAVARVNGWILDKYKFLPMIERAWNLAPRRKWYVFYETDTYVVWDNMFRFLENLDPDTPLYMGSPSPGRRDNEKDYKTWFANGGPGFVLSRAAVLKLLKRKVGQEGDFLEAPLSHRWLDLLRGECCGDSVLGWAFYHAGVLLSGFWPMFNPHPLAGVPYADRYWCQPVITLHKTSPEDMVSMWRWEHGRRELGRPLLYSDLWHWGHPGDPATREDWDNGDWDGFQGPTDVTSFEGCRKACADDPSCFQFNWHASNCWFVRSIRLGWPREPGIEEDREPKEDGSAWTEEEERFTSGWITDKIDKWRGERTCEKVQWVRPSITRIF